VHIQASFGQKTIDVAKFAKLPKGTGKNVTYEPYEPVKGLAPNEVALLFLSHDPVPHGNWLPGIEIEHAFRPGRVEGSRE